VLLKEEELRERRKSKKESRRARRIQRLAERLARDAPDLVDVRIKDPPDGPETWKGSNLQYRVNRVLKTFEHGRAASTRFTRASQALPGVVMPGYSNVGKIGTLAAALLAIAARCVRVKKPSGLEAAVMAVAMGMEEPATHPNEQEEAMPRWNARFRLVEPRVREALFDHAHGMKYAMIFGDGKLTPRWGRQMGDTNT
jgi:hypothetical protein